jgi:uncharacterized protein (TIGR03067 family)
MKLLFLGVLSLMLAATTQAGDDQADSKALQGTWLPASAELAGKPFPEQFRKSLTLTIKDDHYTVMAEQKYEGTLKLDAGKTPKTMEIKGTQGPNQGKTIPAIYKVEGDSLTICYNLAGKDFPTEFKSKTGTKLFLVEYKREKP